MIKIATPVSDLFKKDDYAARIIDNSDCLECRDNSIKSGLRRQEVFHCDMQPIHELKEEDFKYLSYIKNTKPELRLATFHMATSCSQPFIKNNIFEAGGRRYSKDGLLRNARKNFAAIKKIFGSKIKVAVENNNYYPTEAYKYVTNPEFISEVIHQNKLLLLFDMAHAFITSYNTGTEYEDYKQRLPLDRIIQIHICSYGVRRNRMAYDAHTYPKDRDYEEVKCLLSHEGVRYLTVEYYRDIRRLITALKKLRKLL